MSLWEFYVRWLGMETSHKYLFVPSLTLHLQYINVSTRISSLRIPRYMDHYMCLSSSAVIKQQFRSQLGITNIGLYMLLSVISIITLDMPMGMGSSLWVFIYSQRYLIFFYPWCYSDVWDLTWNPFFFFISWQGCNWDCWVLTVPPKAISCFLVTYIGIASPWWKKSLRLFNVLMDIIDV